MKPSDRNNANNDNHEEKKNDSGQFGENVIVENYTSTGLDEQILPSIATLVFTDIEVTQFEKIGFNCAFSKNQDAAYNKVEASITKWLDSINDTIERNHTFAIQNIFKNVEQLNYEISRLKDKKQKHLEDLTDLKNALIATKETHASSIEKLNRKLSEFASARESFFNTVLSKIKSNLFDLQSFY